MKKKQRKRHEEKKIFGLLWKAFNSRCGGTPRRYSSKAQW